MYQRQANKQKGFTLLELMMTVLIVGLIVGFGAPGLQTLVYNSKRTTAFQTLFASMQMARNEAIIRAQQVTLCKLDNSGAACATSNAADWEYGWMIFVDKDNDEALDATDIKLRVFESLGADIHIEATKTGGSKLNLAIPFDVLGRAGETGTFYICDPRGEDYATGISVPASGKPSAYTGAISANDCK